MWYVMYLMIHEVSYNCSKDLLVYRVLCYSLYREGVAGNVALSYAPITARHVRSTKSRGIREQYGFWRREKCYIVFLGRV